jgi:hypothetical protein
LDLEANRQVTERQTKDKSENGEEYVGLIETQYRNLMLDKQVLKIEERPARCKLFLPQEVVHREIWVGVFKEGTIIDNDFYGKSYG